MELLKGILQLEGPQIESLWGIIDKENVKN